jgi:SAM-dependent methyltransferase
LGELLSESSVKAFWEARAQDHSVTDVEATHRDVWQRWLEIETIKPYLRASDRLIDIGCGAGYATRVLAPMVKDALGVDYSESMIERAQSGPSQPSLRFGVADVLALDPATLGQFDVALSVRCLINLASWELQQQAIAQIAGLLRPGGRFIFVEGSADGRRGLNEMRQRAGLEAMPVVWHNVDFEEAQLLPFLDRHFTVLDRRHFGVYDFVARVVHPMSVAPEAPVYDSPVNRTAAQLALLQQEFGGVSRVAFLVLERRG